MSLTFQLARGGLAFALFGALALTAWLAPPAGSTRAIFITEDGTVAAICPVPPPVLRLASAPGDLPSLSRSAGSCRA